MLPYSTLFKEILNRFALFMRCVSFVFSFGSAAVVGSSLSDSSILRYNYELMPRYNQRIFFVFCNTMKIHCIGCLRAKQSLPPFLF